ncbi:MAG: T9SS type A sorting domain-containing protein [Bacteroidetes bacterium]|nr:T9SS type A sorting domain-containing protein [Bacteroidota bacterium]
MKRSLLFISLLGSMSLYAQYITLDPAYSEVDGDPSEMVEVNITLQNTGETQAMNWLRTVNDIPDFWSSSVCDYNLCYGPNTDEPTDYFESVGGTSGTVYVRFDARNYYDGEYHPIPGCGTVEIVYYSVLDSANYNALGVFHARLGVTEEDCGGVWISPSLDNSFSVYPNPAINSLNVVASFSAHISKVEIVNIVGMSVQEVKWNTSSGKMTFDITELPQGIYFVRLLNDKNAAVYTEKISVTQ